MKKKNEITQEMLAALRAEATRLQEGKMIEITSVKPCSVGVSSEDLLEGTNNIHFDSRKIEEGDVFVAIKGTQYDGHDFVEQALEKGAKIIFCEHFPPVEVSNKYSGRDIKYVLVKNTTIKLGELAALRYDFPSRKLKLIGVTGTNGKTTIATSLFNMTRLLGYKAGLISTNAIKIEDTEFAATHTTPDVLQLNYYLNEMVENGCDYCFMEVSSHAIAQQRIAELTFYGGIFTNITHDHLDYHKTFADYIKAKKRFFMQLPKTAFALTNIDDKNGRVVTQNSTARKYRYSLKSAADYKAKILENHFDGMLLDIDNQEVWTNFVGDFNAYNLLAVYATMLLCGFAKDEVLVALSKLVAVEGRFDVIRSDGGIFAIVDYAHTPDALEKVLTTINDIRQGGGNLITVVGCGGDRDKAKRPKMATIAAELSDRLILTSDNPRTEDPEQILDDMQNGLSTMQLRKTLRITNRLEAIKAACVFAQKGDIILVAGKGHEKYQDINGTKHHFDDKEIIINNIK
jgi:UDP-N-acetylmuramoyl-L-alanyl-D-glutamate--2,6-diaminopimelate ligase